MPTAPGLAADPDEAARLARENAQWTRELEAASGSGFYLVLDAPNSALRLMFEGVVLEAYPVRELALGRPRLLFIQRDLPAGWQERIWDGGRLDPARRGERVEIVAPDPEENGEETVEIPPTPAEAFPAPERFSLLFDGGLTLEIVRAKSSGSSGFLRDRLSAIRLADGERLRIRITLDPAQVDAFYRAVPESTRFVLRPAGP
jgi:hypothetical protein